MQKLNRSFIVIFLFWACIFASLFAMSIEMSPKTGGWAHWDKVQHITGFGILTILGCFAYPQKKKWVCAGLAFYGALVEYVQYAFTATRTASLGDWLADVFGILLALGILALIKNQCAKNVGHLSSNSA